MLPVAGVRGNERDDLVSCCFGVDEPKENEQQLVLSPQVPRGRVAGLRQTPGPVEEPAA